MNTVKTTQFEARSRRALSVGHRDNEELPASCNRLQQALARGASSDTSGTVVQGLHVLQFISRQAHWSANCARAQYHIRFGAACSKARHCCKLRRSCPTWNYRGSKMSDAHAARLVLLLACCTWSVLAVGYSAEEGLQVADDPRVACLHLCGAAACTTHASQRMTDCVDNSCSKLALQTSGNWYLATWPSGKGAQPHSSCRSF